MTHTAMSLDVSVAEWQEKLQAELDRYLKLLLAHASPEKVILFGSLAQDQVHLWSDIDLIVVADTDAASWIAPSKCSSYSSHGSD